MPITELKKPHLNRSRSNPQAIIIHTTLNSAVSTETIGTLAQLTNQWDPNPSEKLCNRGYSCPVRSVVSANCPASTQDHRKWVARVEKLEGHVDGNLSVQRAPTNCRSRLPKGWGCPFQSQDYPTIALWIFYIRPISGCAP